MYLDLYLIVYVVYVVQVLHHIFKQKQVHVQRPSMKAYDMLNPHLYGSSLILVCLMKS